jgi:thiopeptide-type bacteriocin biosynthesis protein
VIFKMPGAGQIHLEAITGPSAVNLISRFGHADAGFQDLACTITAREEAHNPGVLFAEIVHLPEKRTGNILLRPHLRSFEIPYLAASGLPQARQIPLQDLYLRVAGDRIVLFSRELNQEIIPRLDTAHLYTAASLPVYLFLCDLQTQGLQAELALSWQPHRFDVTYLPRLTCGNFILGLATWQLNRPDYALLLEASPHTLMTAFEQFKQQWGLPEQFTFGEGDRDLLVDSCNPDTIAAWVHTIRQRSGITLREHLYDVSQSVVKDEAGQPYAAQFIGTLINQEAVYAPGAPLPRIREPEAQQEFPPGSEWLYYKIYGGAQSAETVLTEALTPLTEELRQMNLVDQWFFLRYQDPDPHIRLRLHLLAPEQIGAVISRVYQCLRPYQESGLVWQTQIATYQRETGRYGAQGIKLAEELFFADSLAITGFLSRRPEAGEDQRWTWALAAIDQMLTCFQYTLNQKSQLISNLKAVFAGEFKLNKDLKLGLDKKYRHYRPLIQQDWEGYRLAHQAPYQGESLALLGSAARQLLARASQGQLEVPLDELLSSFIHLHVNRLIPAQARLHELVLYDFLFRHYQMLLAREKQKPLISFPR